MDSIHQIVREATENYTQGTTKLGKYVNWSMYDTVETIDAYLNSKHTSGSQDSLGREKPFFNIVTAAVNIWYRATDLDRKNIKILPDKRANTTLALLASVYFQSWMDKHNFGMFLNQWGRALARYGSAVVKFIEKEGELIPSVVPWNRFIADPVDFDAIPRIEKFYKTPAQLRKMTEYDQEMVDRLIQTKQSRETLEGFQKDNEDNFIEIYEVHGELPTWWLDDEPEAPTDIKEVKYRQQMHVISYIETNEGKYDDFTLFKGKESRDPYMITHLIEEDGRTLSIGAVEYLFDAQWMKNHTMKQWKDQLDLSSKLIFQTADNNFVGRNVLSAIEIGDIMIHEINKPLTLINNQSRDVGSIQAFGNEWNVLSRELTSTPEALRGNTMPSGTAYRQVALLQQEANSLFEIMTENKGLDLEKMCRKFIIPHLQRQLDTKDEIIAVLDAQGIAEVDSMYVPKEAVKQFNKRTVDKFLKMSPDDILKGNIPSPFMQQEEENSVRQGLAPLGNKRFFKPDDLDEKSWKEVLKGDFWDNLKVEITNENSDKNAVLTTLNSVLQTIASNPLILQDPNAKMILSEILTETGRISPLQISASAAQPTASPPVGGAEALSGLTN